MNDPTKRPERLAIVALILSLVFGTLSWFLGYMWAESRLIMCTVTPIVVAALYSFVGCWHSVLVRQEAREKEDRDRVKREYDREDLFEDADDEMNLAASAHKSFDKWFITTFTLVLGSLLIWRVIDLGIKWQEAAPGMLQRNAMQAAGISFFLMLMTLLSGSYFNGLSRERGCRWLRPIAQWFLLTAAIYLLAVVVMLLELFNIGVYDNNVARFVLIVLGIFGAELIFNFIVEFYRPRGVGEEERPLYDSRLLGVVTEPGGVAKNVAHSLDYQFGFKVSETWFYTFVERAVIPITIALAVTLYLLSCFVQIDSGYLGIREHFGKPNTASVLQPGLHVKLPWPMQRIRKYPIDKIQSIAIGFEHEDDNHEPDPEVPEEMQGDPTGKIIVWDKMHQGRELHFLVATEESSRMSRDESSPASEDSMVSDAQGQPTQSVPVNLLSINIPVYYQIKPDQLAAYAYNYKDSADVLRQLASREAVNYFSSADFLQVIGPTHSQARAELESRITNAVESLDPPLGIKVEFVSLSGIHPPTEVAASFQEVVGANEEKQTLILQAERKARQIHNQAVGESYRRTLEAEAYKLSKQTVSGSEAEQFAAQLIAYKMAPDVFMVRAFLDMLEQVAPGTRKYVIAADIDKNQQILEINLEEKLRMDMLQDLDMNAPEN